MILTAEEHFAATSPFQKLWVNKNTAASLRGWYGFGIGYVAEKPVLTFLVKPGSDLKEFKSQVASMTNMETRLLPVRFRQLETGASIAWDNPLQPGNFVFGKEADGGESCHGTIGPFLRYENPEQDDPTWLLSSRHTMVKKEEKAGPRKITLLGASEDEGSNENTILSEDVRFTPRMQAGNMIDAAIAQVKDPKNVHQTFGDLPIKSTAPIDLIEPVIVQKLGNVTDTTEGIFICRCDVVTVFNCKDNGSADYVNQLLIGSLRGKGEFLDKGDSGALLASQGRPAGLVFARNEKLPAAVKLPDPPPDFVSPFALANPFQTVLDQLKPLVQKEGKGRSLEMVPISAAVKENSIKAGKVLQGR